MSLQTLPTAVPRRALTRTEFERMAELGFFESERVELLYGAIVTMTPIGPSHSDLVDVLTEWLVLALRGRATVRVQNPLAASEVSEPVPDLAVVPRGRYRAEHPSQAVLVIEVADSSLAKDRGVKARLYAEMGVPEYWLLDVRGQAIEVFSQPRKGKYARHARLTSGKTARVSAYDDVAIAVRALFDAAS